MKLRQYWGKNGNLDIQTWARDYKTFFMLNSAEHEFYPANKSQITYNCFLAKECAQYWLTA